MDIELNRIVGGNLRTVRLDQGVTQVELARRLDAPQSFVSKVESGERALKLYEVYWYAEALEVSVEELVRSSGRGVTRRPTGPVTRHWPGMGAAGTHGRPGDSDRAAGTRRREGDGGPSGEGGDGGR